MNPICAVLFFLYISFNEILNVARVTDLSNNSELYFCICVEKGKFGMVEIVDRKDAGINPVLEHALSLNRAWQKTIWTFSFTTTMTFPLGLEPVIFTVTRRRITCLATRSLERHSDRAAVQLI